MKGGNAQILPPLNLTKDTPKKGSKSKGALSVSSKSRADEEKEVKFAIGTNEEKGGNTKKGAHG